MSSRPIKQPPRIGTVRGTRSNLKNGKIKARNTKTRRNKERIQANFIQKRYEKLSSTAWRIMKTSWEFTPYYQDPSDSANNLYSIEDAEGILYKSSHFTTSPQSYVNVTMSEIMNWKSRRGKYALQKGESDIDTVLGTVYSCGFKRADQMGYERSPRTVLQSRSTISLRMIIALAFLSAVGAEANWYSWDVPFNERNIANNIQLVSDGIGSLCHIAAAGSGGGAYNPFVWCAVSSNAVSAAAGAANMGLRLKGHRQGTNPLTNTQISSVINSGSDPFWALKVPGSSGVAARVPGAILGPLVQGSVVAAAGPGNGFMGKVGKAGEYKAQNFQARSGHAKQIVKNAAAHYKGSLGVNTLKSSGINHLKGVAFGNKQVERYKNVSPALAAARAYKYGSVPAVMGAMDGAYEVA